jgi:hypothetical protein
MLSTPSGMEALISSSTRLSKIGMSGKGWMGATANAAERSVAFFSRKLN